MKSVRCAIYTRKSSEEGLEQGFNSLDAQREACAAYILSQASEGWQLIPEYYDDGGLSGGTLERPALQRLLGDVADGKIDIIVVYKVDRLTRSLLDFARLVEAFDAANVSFVSITQSFNTTTSMGRLTLNMLLSFAQFEREVTAERIRDKIAASKARGMWMGGVPPLGYRPDGRTLAIVEEHAVLIREIYARYLRLGNVRLLADTLIQDKIAVPRRATRRGRAYGGGSFSRGQLYTILRNPIYAGDIAHKDKRYPGNHPAIISRDIWDRVQQQLAHNVKGLRQTRQANASLLAGLLFDETGEPLIAVHTTRGKQRYRYYVSKAQQHGTASPDTPAIRLPAREIEQVIRQELSSLLADPFVLVERCRFTLTPEMFATLTARCADLSTQAQTWPHAVVSQIISRIVLHPGRIELLLVPSGLAKLLELPASPTAPAALPHIAAVRLKRTGHTVRLIQDDGMAASAATPDPTLVRLLLKAQRWWAELATGQCDITRLSRRENVSASYMTRVVRLAFLAPKIVDAILSGRTLATVDGASLLATGAITTDWDRQHAKFLPAPDGQSLQARKKRSSL
ncbi:recombinase family protein [Caenibius sp. WL]|uniref:recombinase family protein n=1 Tax=Caenibius sp. WL TaxID=2872646 RepID=UPI001C994098|nr:recombinase family protein [Caenibius sp. WL]QZP07694.1 recombinase family protein [Caenibius sp. WL]